MSAPDLTEANPLELWLPVTPRPKGNGRRARGGRVVHPKHVLPTTYAVRSWAAIERKHAPPLEERLVLDVTYYLPTRRRVDVDNLSKLLLDGLKGVVFADDDQVKELRARKVCLKELDDVEQRREPGYLIRVWRWGSGGGLSGGLGGEGTEARKGAA